MCDWDIRLSCPETWIDKEIITLVCEISKQRLNSCTTKTQNTEFRLENDNHPRQMCNVDPNEYEKCNQTTMPDVSQCACYEKSTYFSLKYRFIADKSIHNGTWDCNRPCLDDPFSPDILVKNNSQYCSNVKVLDRGKCRIQFVYYMFHSSFIHFLSVRNLQNPSKEILFYYTNTAVQHIHPLFKTTHHFLLCIQRSVFIYMNKS